MKSEGTLKHFVVALLLAVGVGMGFGLYPARAAAAVPPIDALRAN